MESMDAQVLVIGAGISGLACAKTLSRAGIDVRVLEADHRIGGRIKTDRVDGFLLDHGFQVLQTAYPEVRRQLDVTSLNLQRFAPGVMIRVNRRFYRISDPLRCPGDLWQTLTAPIGNFMDRLRVGRLAWELRNTPVHKIFEKPDKPTPDFLKSRRFSSRMIQLFFTPFFAGACLDPEIQASSRVFQYLFHIFSSGDATLPAQGMGAIANQLAAAIPEKRIHTGTRVTKVQPGRVTLDNNGQILHCKQVVIATQGPESARLLDRPWHSGAAGEICFYFAADTAPVFDPYLILNSDGGRIQLVAVPSLTAPDYAPSGKALIAAVVLGNLAIQSETLLTDVRQELQSWFGPETKNWQHLKTFEIPYALPRQTPPAPDPTRSLPPVSDGIHVCGELDSVPGIQWALLSGRLAARQLIDTQ
jgi:phytoene dehydrogenase-like protein